MKVKTHIRSAAERRDMERDIQRQVSIEIGKQMKGFNREIYAIIAWVLYESEGYGKTRIQRVLRRIRPLLDELNERYELERFDTVACIERLRRQGIDIDKILTEDDWIIAHSVSKEKEGL